MKDEKENKFFGLEETIRKEYEGRFVTDNDVELNFNFGSDGELVRVDLNLTPNSTTSFVIKDINVRVGVSLIDVIMELLNEDGRSNAEIYKSVFMDRRVFQKIIRGKSVSKENYARLAIALKLNLDKTNLLFSAGSLAFNPTKKWDIIIQYAIEHKIYDPFEIDETLCAYGEPPLFTLE